MSAAVLCVPNDEIEARAIAALLEEAKIRYKFRRNADTAYPGVADRGASWGSIVVAEDDLPRAHAVLADFLDAQAEEAAGPATTSVEPQGPYRTRPEREERLGDTRLLRVVRTVVLLLVGSTLLVTLAATVRQVALRAAQ
jgi:hypothetical protein